MAIPVMVKYWLLVLALINITYYNCKLGNSEEDYPEVGGALTGNTEEDYPEVGGATADPAQTVSKALLCFNNNYIYSSCEESYRLTESGTLHVPREYTDQYCNGPCQEETHLVLDCIGNIFLHFEFYNKATIQDVRKTIKAGCGHDTERGNFNVEEHLRAEESKADKITIYFFVPMLILLGQCLFF